MSKKLSNNGLWESSRMMLQQHKEALLQHQHEQHRQERPLLDEMVWEEISRRLQWSMENRDPITLLLYDPFEQREAAGIVVDIDMIGQRVRVQEGEERIWISVEDILGGDEFERLERGFTIGGKAGRSEAEG
ncbi:YolD-like family protein [Paenibacillus thiaminolyticus]|uniref:YolD-like family protein n=1 Tax=Paenibacillus thiaminolyticus TaxID=49283 RepID=UPI001F10542E|nr:YolD-like family protein [Paenibacillus thiaminolyticus]